MTHLLPIFAGVVAIIMALFGYLVGYHKGYDDGIRGIGPLSLSSTGDLDCWDGVRRWKSRGGKVCFWADAIRPKN